MMKNYFFTVLVTLICVPFLSLNAQDEFLYEDFSSGSYFILWSWVESDAFLQNGNAVLTGGTNTSWWGNGDATTPENAWVNNYDHRATVSEYVDASNYNQIELKVKIRQTAEASVKHSWFRVLVNGYHQTDVCGNMHFNPVTLNDDPYRTLTFNLNHVAGTNFVLSFQSSCKLALLDAVYIDEIRLIYNNYESPVNLPFSENFNIGRIPQGWSNCSDSLSFGWQTGQSTSVPGSGNYMYCENYANDSVPLISQLRLPIMDFSYQQDINMLFNLYASYPVHILASVDSGLTWNDTLATVNSTPGSWQPKLVSLNSLANESYLQLAFAVADTSDTFAAIAVDDIAIISTSNSTVDLEVDTLLSPSNQAIYSQYEAITIQVSNNDTQAITGFLVGYKLDTFMTQIEFLDTTLLAGESLTHTFSGTIDLSDVGTYSLSTWVYKSYDIAPSNDTLLSIIHVTNPTITDYPYFQSFEGIHYWQSGGMLPSWQLGHPSGTVINSTTHGQNAWVTNLNGVYNSYENSYVMSPVYDMSNLNSPVMEFDLFLSTVEIEDGACVEYSTDAGNNWQVLGQTGDPNNWYNSNWVYALFSTGQLNGWSGDPFFDWVSAKYYMPALGGESLVRFRITFGSSDNFDLKEGFAFDRFMIYDYPTQDLAMNELISPNYECVLSSEEVITIQVKNAGLNQINGFTASYSLDGSTFVSEQVYQSILPDSMINYSFSTLADLSALGQHEFILAVHNVNDEFIYNDTITVNLDFYVAYELPFVENFESGQLSEAWSMDISEDSDGWLVGTDQSSTYFNPPSHTSYASSNDDSCYCDMSRDLLITPYFDFTNYQNIELSFSAYSSGLYGSSGHILVSADCGINWINIYDIPANAISWQNLTVDLSTFAGEGSVKIAFHHNDHGGWADGLAIDDISISGNLSVENQEIPLLQGWGMFSTYIEPAEASIDTIFNNIIQNVIIVKSGTGLVYWPVFGINAIDTLVLGQGYQYKLENADTLFIDGLAVIPDQTPILLPAGWSIMAYLRNSPGPVVQMLNSIGNEIIIVKEEQGLVYWPVFGINSIGDMYPGKGYQLKLTNSAVLTYPSN